MLNLRWIEIGTADFETWAKTAPRADPRHGIIGLCIEPLKYYIDRLPDRPDMIKVCAAITEETAPFDIYWVNETAITKGIPNWMRGCNSVGKPHPSVVAKLKSQGFNPDEFISKDTCEGITWETLVKRYDIGTVEHIKIDTEGYDVKIVRQILAWYDDKRHLLPYCITFESNRNIAVAEVDLLIEDLREYGYQLIERGDDTVVILSHRVTIL